MVLASCSWCNILIFQKHNITLGIVFYMFYLILFLGQVSLITTSVKLLTDVGWDVMMG